MFVKLFGTILDSSIWQEDDATRLVWITMLAMAGPDGFVRASPGGLAHRARVSADQCRHALQVLSSPEIESGTQEYGGRRVEAVEGGWLLLNYQKYRELRTVQQVKDAVRQQRHRAARDTSQQGVTSPGVTTEAEADVEVEAEKDKDTPPTVVRPRGRTWLSPYLAVYHKEVGRAKVGLLADALSIPHKELGPDKALALWTRWCKSDKSDYGPAWFGQHWRKAANGKGATQQQRNFAVLDKVEAEEHGKP